MESTKTLTEAVENYLKAIYNLSIEDPAGATQHRIAEMVGVSISGVSKMLRTMEKSELIEYSPYHPVKLTERGAKVAIEIIRHHRLLELYLVKSLGYSWEDVHREADRLEHYISEQMEERIETLLGFPTVDPHGDPIPTRDGHMPAVSCITLASQPVGARVIVRRVTDEYEDLLRYLAARGVRPGVQLTISDREPFGGSIVIDSAESGTQRISPQAGANVFVEELKTDEP
jgi:DtxR family transcriptional regulator, Mn-dependent transcriptional regulator